ncbi:MAG: hypothetical protein NTX15_06195 [Candidatus Kapabacteria bacterium]|nr:hypothetical protein [Candidatus Kapabacteria bacterium]
MTRFLLVITVLIAPSLIYARTATELLNELKAKMQRVKQYTAELSIKVDVPFMKVPVTTATLTHIAPDKTTIDAPGFAMIPKQGADMSALKLLSKDFTAVDMGTEQWQGVVMRKIKVLPADEDQDVVVATLWIDTTMMVARKIVSTTKKAGTITAELVYSDAKARAYSLPSYTKIIMEIGSFEIPKSMSGDFNESSRDTKPKAGPQKAVVEIWYGKFRIQNSE